MNKVLIDNYTELLSEELLPAQGCTEPIAIAYAGALLRDLLGGVPEKIVASISRNIIKNAKSVIVPNTGGQKGIEAAISAGVVAGESEKVLEVIASVGADSYQAIDEYIKRDCITVQQAQSQCVFVILLEGEYDGHKALLEIRDTHTNLVYEELDGDVLLDKRSNRRLKHLEPVSFDPGTELLTVKTIIEYVNKVPFEDIEPMIKRQIEYNTAIAEDALEKNYGANIGKVLMFSRGATVKTRAKAMAAAGSDGRMSGSELPVIIVCGSGNQGITASLPIVEYAKHYEISDDKLYRAIALSDLIAVHIKAGIGTLSAFCGAVSAGCSAGAGICYMLGGSDEDICNTIVNSLAIVSGMICDGAKPSCAGKIAIAVEAGIMGYEMATAGQKFQTGDGIVAKEIEDNIRNIARLGREGMRDTDNEIMDIMLEK